MALQEHIIVGVKPGSTAEELGLVPGDAILEINGEPIMDIFDYQFFMEEENIELLVQNENGEEVIW